MSFNGFSETLNPLYVHSRFEFQVTKLPQVTYSNMETKLFRQISLWGMTYVFF